MRKETKQKIMVIVVGVIFLGSMAGFMLSPVAPPQEKIPEQKILTQLTATQKAQIISVGNIIINVSMPPDCDVCAIAVPRLEGYTQTYDPWVYLLKIEGGETFSIGLQSYAESRQLTAFNATAIENFICENVPARLKECILREI